MIDPMKTHSRSRPRTRWFGLVGAALLATTAATSTFAQGAGAPPPPPQAQGPAGDKGPEARGPGAGPEADGPRMMSESHGPRGGPGAWRHGPRGMYHGHGMRDMVSPARLAVALSAMETGIGIKADQMDAWRTFTGSLIAFAEASEPSFGPGMRPGPDQDADDQGQDGSDQDVGSGDAAPTAPGASDTDAEQADRNEQDSDLFAFRLLDRIADQAIDRGEKAQALKSALDNLETTLTPDQIQAARGLIRSMVQEAREMRGPRAGRHFGHRPKPWMHYGERWGGMRGPGGPHGPNNGDRPAPRGPGAQFGNGGPDGGPGAN